MPATVSDFQLDAYEVTVGRFRAFVRAGKGTQASPPVPGAGAHPKIAGSGWESAFASSLAPSTVALEAQLVCNKAFATWTALVAQNEARPINCVTWFEAFAFCAWDGGRLPTDAEWNYAAAGGDEKRDYPWGQAPADPTRASYDCLGDGSDPACSISDLLPAGSRSPAGDGRWGQADLAGNVWEWSLDWHASPFRIADCTDCADLATATGRVVRGGAFNLGIGYLLPSQRLSARPDMRDGAVGFRCARLAIR